MKLLFDRNISPKLVGLLATEFPGSAHVRDVGLSAAPDPDVWAFARSQGFVVVSKDTDFQQRALLYGHPPKVIWVRLGNCTTAAVARLLRSRLADIEAFESDPLASFMTPPSPPSIRRDQRVDPLGEAGRVGQTNNSLPV